MSPLAALVEKDARKDDFAGSLDIIDSLTVAGREGQTACDSLALGGGVPVDLRHLVAAERDDIL